jgi:hypothetical protein
VGAASWGLPRGNDITGTQAPCGKTQGGLFEKPGVAGLDDLGLCALDTGFGTQEITESRETVAVTQKECVRRGTSGLAGKERDVET